MPTVMRYDFNRKKEKITPIPRYYGKTDDSVSKSLSKATSISPGRMPDRIKSKLLNYLSLGLGGN